MKLSEIFQEEFSNVATYTDFKKTVTSFNKLMYGLIVFVLVALSVFAPWLYLVPLFFITLSYIGKVVDVFITYYQKNISQAITKENRPIIKRKINIKNKS